MMITRIGIFAMLCAMAGVVSAGIINYAELGVAQGGTAVYDASAGTITWSGGASGKVLLSDGQSIEFNQSEGASVTITGGVTGTPGTGSGTLLTMSGLTFTLTFGPYGQTVDSAIVISGSLADAEVYTESLNGIVPGLGAILTGSGIVDVSAYAVNDPSGETYAWIEEEGSKIETTMIGVGDFTGYNQDYTTNNLVIKVFGSDFVPEPATLSLLGLGAMSLFARKERK